MPAAWHNASACTNRCPRADRWRLRNHAIAGSPARYLRPASETQPHRRRRLPVFVMSAPRWRSRTSGCAPSAADRKAAHHFPRYSRHGSGPGAGAHRRGQRQIGPDAQPAASHSTMAATTCPGRRRTPGMSCLPTPGVKECRSTRCAGYTPNNLPSPRSSGTPHHRGHPAIRCPPPNGLLTTQTPRAKVPNVTEPLRSGFRLEIGTTAPRPTEPVTTWRKWLLAKRRGPSPPPGSGHCMVLALRPDTAKPLLKYAATDTLFISSHGLVSHAISTVGNSCLKQ